MAIDTATFERDGFIAVRGAFPRELAETCTDVIWTELESQGVLRSDPSTWTRPVVRINTPIGECFRLAAQSPSLEEAYNALLGAGRWTRRDVVGGTVPARFPSNEPAGDTGWHIDGTTWNGDTYVTEVTSKGRGLLALFLFVDVTLHDAPTEILVGSHLAVPPVLAKAAEPMDGGWVPTQLEPLVFEAPIASATGDAGDVYLCHPFLVHRATDGHMGKTPRFMAQPGIVVPGGFAIDGTDASPVGRAIAQALG